MIKLSVLYPNEEGKKFDIKYYCSKHLPMVQEMTGAACKKIAVEQGVAGGTPGSAAIYTAMGHFYFDTIDDFNASFVPHIDTFVSDIPNFTDIAPVVQISEVII